MKISYETIHRWLTAHAGGCSIGQLNELSRLINLGLDSAREDEARLMQAFDQAKAAAESVGLDVTDLLRRGLGVQAPSSFTSNLRLGPQPRTGVRRPYLNPLVDDGQIHAIRPKNPRPEWLINAEQAGFTLAECHYKRIGDAWRARSMTPLYPDPVQTHADRVAAEPVRFQRNPSRKTEKV